jgi:hypothetical protein
VRPRDRRAKLAPNIGLDLKTRSKRKAREGHEARRRRETGKELTEGSWRGVSEREHDRLRASSFEALPQGDLQAPQAIFLVVEIEKTVF